MPGFELGVLSPACRPCRFGACMGENGQGVRLLQEHWGWKQRGPPGCGRGLCTGWGSQQSSLWPVGEGRLILWGPKGLPASLGSCGAGVTATASGCGHPSLSRAALRPSCG